jgi:hypothetical protein
MPKKNLQKARKDWEKNLGETKERQPEFLTTSSVPIEATLHCLKCHSNVAVNVTVARNSGSGLSCSLQLP